MLPSLPCLDGASGVRLRILPRVRLPSTKKRTWSPRLKVSYVSVAPPRIRCGSSVRASTVVELGNVGAPTLHKDTA
jgi:hypothetical protein